MAALHEALERLHPRDFSQVPVDYLAEFLDETLAAAEVIVNSVPHPPLPSAETRRSCKKPATCLSELVSSSERLHAVHPDHESLSKNWGKPLKISAKESAIGLAVYKMAANDRHGAWFARRSVHEGLPFDKWKRAMQSEFAESLAVQDGPGSGSIRGIGVDRLLERTSLGAKGMMEVYDLSAQFPGPTTARNFVTLLLTSDNGLTDQSSEYVGGEKVNSKIPRHYMMASIPVEHPDAPPREGLVRGQYESVEMIRELPRRKTESQPDTSLHATSELASSVSRVSVADSSTTSHSGTDGNMSLDSTSKTDERLANPVEWIMITRSDPGGGIPRFMVERGTPSSITSSAIKFLEWATSRDTFILDKIENDLEISRTMSQDVAPPPLPRRRLSDSNTFEPPKSNDSGMISSLTNVVKGGLEKYAPESLQHGISSLMSSPEDPSDHNNDSTETCSLDSFASAEQFTTAPDVVRTQAKNEVDSHSETSSVKSTTEAANLRLEKRLARLRARRKGLDEKFEKDMEREKTKAKEKMSKDSREKEKVQQRLEREIKKQEDKHDRELKKLEEKQRSEERRAAERKRKATDADTISRIRRELEQSRRVAEVLRLENDVWQQRMGDVQRENTKLVSRLIKLEGGQQLLREIRAELARESSANSSHSAVLSNLSEAVESSDKLGKKNGLAGSSKSQDGDTATG